MAPLLPIDHTDLFDVALPGGPWSGQRPRRIYGEITGAVAVKFEEIGVVIRYVLGIVSHIYPEPVRVASYLVLNPASNKPWEEWHAGTLERRCAIVWYGAS